MNIQIISSIIMVALTAAIAVFQEKRRSDVKETAVKLEKRAVTLGIEVEGVSPARSGASSSAQASNENGQPGSAGRRTPGGASSSNSMSEAEKKAKAFAAELLQFVAEMKAIEASGEEPSMEQQMKLMAFMGRFLKLDAEVIPFLVAELRESDDLGKEEKQGIVMMSFMTLANSSPKKAMEFYINSGDLLSDQRQVQGMAAMALGKWGGEDPRAALAWLQTNREKLSDDMKRGAEQMVIANAFKADPNFAAEHALKMEKDKILEVAAGVSGVLGTPKAHLDLLRTLEGQLGEVPNIAGKDRKALLESASKEQVLHGGLLVALGSSLAEQPFEEASKSLQEAELSAAETEIVSRGLADHAHNIQEPGSWLNWIDENASAGVRDEATRDIVGQWTQQDFRATAAWITDLEPGPMRDRSIHSFAETVAPHEPASAAAWAEQLPESQERKELLRNIHTQWSKEDEGAAAAFATKHGIQASDVPESNP